MASGAEREPEESVSPEAANTNQQQPTGVGEGTADDQCSICLSEISSPAYTSDCFHIFCFGCIWQWACRRAVCPLCRKPIDGILQILRMETFQENPGGLPISQQMPEDREDVGSRSSQQQLSPRSSSDDPTEESREPGGEGEAQPEAAPEASSQQGARENPAGSHVVSIVHYGLQVVLDFMEDE